MQSKFMNRAELLARYRWVLGFFIFGLVLSGLTAFPLQHELDWITAALDLPTPAPNPLPGGLDGWLLKVREGLCDTYAHYPWLGYGTDWLAFAHVVIALFFIGPWLDPVRNVWVLKAGLMACALVLPLALIAGPLRGIPFGWQLIDCSFGVLGAIPLVYCVRLTPQMQIGANQSD